MPQKTKESLPVIPPDLIAEAVKMLRATLASGNLGAATYAANAILTHGLGNKALRDQLDELKADVRRMRSHEDF